MMGKEKIPQEKKAEGKNLFSRPASMGRRDILKGLASLPVGGAFLSAFWKEKKLNERQQREILEALGLEPEEGPPLSLAPKKKPTEIIRLGIIGVGGRGEHLLRAAGFVHPGWVENKRIQAQEDKLNKELETFLEQEELGVELTAVCDIYDPRAERGLIISQNALRQGRKIEKVKGAHRYRHYQELLSSPDVDAVFIATPDHWHAQMALDAVAAGKHVYLEKCMTRTAEEAVRLYDRVKPGRIIFQLGHQQRQQESHQKARLIVAKNILGKITLVQTTTNRNSPDGAWQYEIPAEAGPHNIDWDQFLGPAPRRVPFDVYRFFRWRCWFDYGTGLSGDLLSHEFDAVNQILELGIPHSATASGGIYFFKDSRDVPDVFHVSFEYPERELTLFYSATLSSNRSRGRLFMGHDASLEVGEGLVVTADPESTRYKEKFLTRMIDTSSPLFSYWPGRKAVDTVTSASERYFLSRGLLYSYREGKRVDTTHLHIKEWLEGIRENRQPSCNIERGFEEAITCHMATESYLRGRRVEWDPVRREIV